MEGIRLKKNRIFVAFLAVSCLVSLASFAQSEVKDFPVGTTNMVYEIKTEDVAAPQTITLNVEGYADGRYHLRMSVDSTGTADELGVFGFLFGMTQTSTGGASVTFDPLGALFQHRDRLTAGEEYRLEGGATFTGTELVTIAGLPCLQGAYTNPKQPDVRITVAFSLLRPVFISPYIREEELRNGQWVETFSLKLTQYAVNPA